MKKTITPNDAELKELFALFSSASLYELRQIYDKNNDLFFMNEILSDEYELTESKREFASDSWRAVIYFLLKNGYQLKKGDEVIDLNFINEEFVSA